MKLTFTVDADSFFNGFDEDGPAGPSLADVLTESLKKQIIKTAKNEVATEKFKEFSALVSDAILSDVKNRMQNFLNEDIVLTGRYGEKNFVGSIEDLIKQRFDDVLLRAVDGNGKTLEGCTSAKTTWIEWAIENNLRETKDRAIKDATDMVSRQVRDAVAKQLEVYKSGAIQKEVAAVMANILREQPK